MTLKSFEVWYNREFKFYARSKSDKQLKQTLWFYRGWIKNDIEIKPTESRDRSA